MFRPGVVWGRYCANVVEYVPHRQLLVRLSAERFGEAGEAERARQAKAKLDELAEQIGAKDAKVQEDSAKLLEDYFEIGGLLKEAKAQIGTAANEFGVKLT